MFANTRSLKAAHSKSLSPLSFVSSWQIGVRKCLASFQTQLCLLLHSSLLAQQKCPSSVPGQLRSVAGLFVFITIWCWREHLCYCDVERDCPQVDSDELAKDWATSYVSVHDVLVNKISNAMLMFIIFSPARQCFSISFHRVQGCSICSCPFRAFVPGVSPQLLVSLFSVWQRRCFLFHESWMVQK